MKRVLIISSGERSGKSARLIADAAKLVGQGVNIAYIQKDITLTGCQILDKYNSFVNYGNTSTFPADILNAVDSMAKGAEIASTIIANQFKQFNAASQYIIPSLNDCGDKMDVILNQNGLEPKKAFSFNDDRIKRLKDLSVKMMERRDMILTEFYSTGRIDGLYFGKSCRKTSNPTNPVKAYIKQQLTRNNIKDNTLIDDVYNELFVELYKKEASEICAMYDEAPAKVIATALRIIVLKFFTIDPRYGNPNHSFIRKTMFASIEDGAATVNHFEEHIDLIDQETDLDKIKKITLADTSLEPENFCKRFGFDIEEMLERLTPTDLEAFYSILGKQPRGKTSDAKKVSKEALFNRIRDVKERLQNE